MRRGGSRENSCSPFLLRDAPQIIAASLDAVKSELSITFDREMTADDVAEGQFVVRNASGVICAQNDASGSVGGDVLSFTWQTLGSITEPLTLEYRNTPPGEVRSAFGNIPLPAQGGIPCAFVT